MGDIVGFMVRPAVGLFVLAAVGSSVCISLIGGEDGLFVGDGDGSFVSDTGSRVGPGDGFGVGSSVTGSKDVGNDVTGLEVVGMGGRVANVGLGVDGGRVANVGLGVAGMRVANVGLDVGFGVGVGSVVITPLAGESVASCEFNTNTNDVPASLSSSSDINNLYSTPTTPMKVCTGLNWDRHDKASHVPAYIRMPSPALTDAVYIPLSEGM